MSAIGKKKIASVSGENAGMGGMFTSFDKRPPSIGQGFLQGALIVSMGNFLSKIIGALCRIPLTALLGAEGIGLYQLAYPFYTLLLTIASSGLPSGISRMVAKEISDGNNGRGVARSALKLFATVGMGGTFLMIALRNVVSRLQGEDLGAGFIALAPAVVCVAMISVFRGYFQGKCNMFPTAGSEVIEQVVKGALSIFVAWYFRDNIFYAVTAVLGAVSISELAALLFMAFLYKRERVTDDTSHPCPSFKHILSLTIPVAIAAAVLPLSQFADSAIGVRLLRGYSDQAVALYGLYSGGAVTLVGLPVSICYGLAVSVIPRLQGEGGQRQKVLRSLLFTLLVSVPCAVVLYLFAQPLGKIFFQKLTAERLQILVKLIRIMAPTAVTHACAQTLSACLIGQGKARRAAINMAVAVALKTVLVFLLVRVENISVYGMAIAANGCYFTAFVLNLLGNHIKKNELNGKAVQFIVPKGAKE